MNILTNENKILNTNLIPKEIEDTRFCVLDYNINDIKEEPDYLFQPLIFLESFDSPILELRVGPYKIQLPQEMGPNQNTAILLGDPDLGDLELIPITRFNDREFKCFAMNPISGYMPKFYDIEVINSHPEVKWYFPKIKDKQLLALPLSTGPKPECIFVVNEKEISYLQDKLDIRVLV